MTQTETASFDGEPSRKDLIAAAAERLFSLRAYEGVSIRDVAAEAGVPHGLVRYYFGSKDRLYQSLFEQRYRAITHERMEGLLSRRRTASQVQAVQSIFLAWLEPLARLRSDPQGRHFALLLVREGGNAEHDPNAIFDNHLDPAARVCMDALADVLPQASREQIARGYLWASAVMMSSIAGHQRLERLSGTAAEPMCAQALTAFVSAGLIASLKANRKSGAFHG